MNRKQAELLLAALILLSLCVPHFFDGESKRLRIH